MRERANLWLHLWWIFFPTYGKRWKFDWKIFKNEYFWHDSFGVYLHRWMLCPLLGHSNVNETMDSNSLYCFKCERNVFPTRDYHPGIYKVELEGYNLIDNRVSRIPIYITHIIGTERVAPARNSFLRWENIFTHPERFKAMINVEGKKRKKLCLTRLTYTDLALYTWMGVTTYGEELLKRGSI